MPRGVELWPAAPGKPMWTTEWVNFQNAQPNELWLMNSLWSGFCNCNSTYSFCNWSCSFVVVTAVRQCACTTIETKESLHHRDWINSVRLCSLISVNSDHSSSFTLGSLAVSSLSLDLSELSFLLTCRVTNRHWSRCINNCGLAGIFELKW